MNALLSQCDVPPESEVRVEPRTHLFLVAMLSGAGVSAPIRIRNLSASGALIEGAALPAVGTAVTIRRASLVVEGVVAWKSHSQAGVEFGASILVPAWLPKTAGSRQNAIDRMVFETRNASRAALDEPRPAAPSDAAAAILAEFSSLKDELARLEDALMEDAELVAAHPELQLLDIALQRVARIETLAGEAGFGRGPGPASGPRAFGI